MVFIIKVSSPDKGEDFYLARTETGAEKKLKKMGFYKEGDTYKNPDTNSSAMVVKICTEKDEK